MKIHKKTNYGFVPPTIDEKHYVLGSARSLPKTILQSDRDWSLYRPKFEPQSTPRYDTYGCTIFGTLNAREYLRKRTFGNERNYSDRFLYNLTNTLPPGNDPHTVAEAMRIHGVIDEDLLPMTETFDEYIVPRPPSTELLNLARESLFVEDFGHEWVFEGDLPQQEKINRMNESLQYSVLCASVTAWEEDDNGVCHSNGQPNNHWVDIEKATERGWQCFDTYLQETKIYSYDSDISFCKRYHLGKIEAPVTPVQMRSGFWFWLMSLIVH